MKSIRVHNHGGPEVLTYEDVPIPEPKAGEARVKIEASGLNFIDIYHRTGLYPLSRPFTLGMEGAGVVDAIGDGVTEVKKGERVAYAMVTGSYAEFAIVPAAAMSSGAGAVKVRLFPVVGPKKGCVCVSWCSTAHHVRCEPGSFPS